MAKKNDKDADDMKGKKMPFIPGMPTSKPGKSGKPPTKPAK